MPSNDCRLLVLSPCARSVAHAREYKPFRGKMLAEILDDAASEVAHLERDYDRHRLFAGFFFGKDKPDPTLQKELREGVPSSLVDCAIYGGSEPAAAEAARNALFHFASESGRGGKRIILICDGKCDLHLDYDALRASSDLTLMAYLSCDLLLNTFKRLGRDQVRVAIMKAVLEVTRNGGVGR
jgi:hypothetical protein